MPNLKPNIQEIFPVSEEEAKKLTSKIKNQPITIPFRKDNIVHFLTPSVDKNNHHLRIIFGDEEKLNKYFINPKRKLSKKTFSEKGENIEFKDLHDHSVFLINYKENFTDKMEDFIDKIKQSKENFYNALLTEFTEIENEMKEGFEDLKGELNGLKNKWELYIAKNRVEKTKIQSRETIKNLKKQLKDETKDLMQKLHDKINSQPNEEPHKQFRKRKFCKTYDELKVFNSACEIFNKNNIQTGMIYYYYKEKLYCIYQGDDKHLTACDSLIALMNPQDLAIQNRNPHDSLVKNQNTLTRNHRGNNLQLFKKALIVVSILVTAGLIGALIAAATVLFSPLIALALIPVLGISSLGLYKVCKKAEVVSVNNSLSQQPQEFKSNYLRARVLGNVDVTPPADPSHRKGRQQSESNDDRTTTASFKAR